MNFREAIFFILAEGQDFSGADRCLVNREIDEFIREYQAALGHDPKAEFDSMLMFVHRLERYGYRFPRVERWMKEEGKAVTNYLEKCRKSRFKKEC